MKQLDSVGQAVEFVSKWTSHLFCLNGSCCIVFERKEISKSCLQEVFIFNTGPVQSFAFFVCCVCFCALEVQCCNQDVARYGPSDVRELFCPN
jgi:hypothetical protein